MTLPSYHINQSGVKTVKVTSPGIYPLSPPNVIQSGERETVSYWSSLDTDCLSTVNTLSGILREIIPSHGPVTETHCHNGESSRYVYI